MLHPFSTKRAGSFRVFFFYVIFPFLIFFIFHFHDALFNGGQFCFRDSCASFYPVCLEVQEELNQGRLPLWDPYENLGMPLAGNPASIVFYPPKLIFFLTYFFPGSFGFCYTFFILVHYPLGFWGMYRLLRHWRLSMGSASAAAICYTFSSPFFFQYCNVIYLIGAAWIPWAVLAGDRLFRYSNGSIAAKETDRTAERTLTDTSPTSRPLTSGIQLAVCLALMILGGDPQSAHLTVLLLLGLCIVYRYFRQLNSGFFRSCFRLFVASVFAGILSSLVILPAREMTALSDRSLDPYPTSIWELPQFIERVRSVPISEQTPYLPEEMTGPETEPVARIRKGLTGNSLYSSVYRSQTHQYSLSPFELPNLIWPNVTGNYFHGTQWSVSLPNASMWIPTIYFGIIPFVSALSVLTFFRRRRLRGKDFSLESPNESSVTTFSEESELRWNTIQFRSLAVWGSWTGLAALLLAFGGFGAGWFYRAFSVLCQGGPISSLTFANGDSFGGLYWFFTVFCPMFALFRFPAKILIFLSFSVSILAALGLENVFGFYSPKSSASIRGRRLIVFGILILLLTAVTGTALFFAGRSDQLPSILSDPAFVGQARHSLTTTIYSSLGHTGLVLLIFLFLIFLQRRHLKYSCIPSDRLRKSRGFLALFGSRLNGIGICRTCRVSSSVLFFIVLLLIALDLIFCNRGTVMTRPGNTFLNQASSDSVGSLSSKPLAKDPQKKTHREKDASKTIFGRVNPSPVAAAMRLESDLFPKSDRSVTSGVPSRIALLHPWTPASIMSAVPSVGQKDLSEWLQKGLFPRYNILNRTGTLSPGTSMTSIGYFQFLIASQYIYVKETMYKESMSSAFSAVDADCLMLAPSDSVSPPIGSWQIMPESELGWKMSDIIPGGRDSDWPQEYSLWKLPESGTRLRICRNMAQPSSAKTPTERFIEDFQRLRDASLPGESAKIERYEPTRIEMRIDLKESGELVLAEQYWPDWHATAEPFEEKEKGELRPVSEKRTLTIQPVNGLLRGFDLPAGSWRVVMTYRPRSFYCGLVVSLIGWLAVFALLLSDKIRGRKKNNREKKTE